MYTHHCFNFTVEALHNSNLHATVFLEVEFLEIFTVYYILRSSSGCARYAAAGGANYSCVIV